MAPKKKKRTKGIKLGPEALEEIEALRAIYSDCLVLEEGEGEPGLYQGCSILIAQPDPSSHPSSPGWKDEEAFGGGIRAELKLLYTANYPRAPLEGIYIEAEGLPLEAVKSCVHQLQEMAVQAAAEERVCIFDMAQRTNEVGGGEKFHFIIKNMGSTEGTVCCSAVYMPEICMGMSFFTPFIMHCLANLIRIRSSLNGIYMKRTLANPYTWTPAPYLTRSWSSRRKIAGGKP